MRDWDYLLGDWTPEAKRQRFWAGFRAGFLSVFLHPVTIYGFGFAAGFCVRSFIGA